jgi:hypothetical protein
MPNMADSVLSRPFWREAATAREHLSHVLTPEGEPRDLVALVLRTLAQGRLRATWV